MIDMTPLAGVVAAFATGELTVRRPGVVSMVNGRRVPGAGSTPVTGVIGSIWPITGDDVSVDEDGRRQNHGCTIYCLQAMTPADDITGQPGDIVTHEGVDYEVVFRQPWTRGAFFVYEGRDIKHP